jgi:hypothetical protein
MPKNKNDKFISFYLKFDVFVSFSGAGCDPQVSARGHHGAHGDRRQREHGALHLDEVRHREAGRRLPDPRGQGVQPTHPRQQRRGAAAPARQGVAQAARVGALLAHRQVHPRQGHHRQQGHGGARGGRRHRRRHQRRTGPQEGRRRLCNGQFSILKMTKNFYFCY